MARSSTPSAAASNEASGLPPFLATDEFPARLLAPILFGVGLTLWLCTLFYFTSGHGLKDLTGEPLGRDFMNFWSAGQLTLAGRSAAVFDPEQIRQFYEARIGPTGGVYFWSYPPYFLLYVLPLGLLPYVPALIAWIAVSVALYLRGALGARPTRWELAALLLSPATILCVFCCQTGLLAAALLLAGLRLLDRRPHAAGILFGLLVFKPQAALLLPVAIVAGRRWRVVPASLLTAALVIGAGLLLLDGRDWPGYLSFNAPATARMELFGIGPFMYMEPSLTMAARLLGLPSGLGFLLQAGMALGVAGLVWATFRRVPFQDGLPALLIGTCLISPYFHNYDMTITAAGLLYFVRDRRNFDLPAGTVLLIALTWILPVLMMPLHYLVFPAAPLLIAATLVLVARRIVRTPA